MPRTYGGKAAEDIEFRMGLMGAALPSRGGLTAGPVTTSASRGSVPGIPGAGIMGSIPGSALGTGAGTAGPPASGGGMTGGQLGLSILGGVASFMGGYQRNPGLLQISRNMNYALRESFAQQQAQATAKQRAAIIQDSSQNDRDSLISTAERLYAMGDVKTADSFMDRAETLWKRDNLTLSQRLQQVRPFSIRSIEQKQVIQNFNQTIEDRGGFENLTQADAIGLAMQFQRGEIPGVLSDQEYNRIAGMQSGSQIINAMKAYVGLPPEAPPTDVIKALYQRAYSNATAADKDLESMAEFMKIKDEFWRGREMPKNQLPGLFQMPRIPESAVSSILGDAKQEVINSIPGL